MKTKKRKVFTECKQRIIFLFERGILIEYIHLRIDRRKKIKKSLGGK